MSLGRVHTIDTEPSADSSVEAPGDVNAPHARAGGRRLLPRILRLTFAPESLERLYQSYFRRQRQENLLVLALFAALFNGFIIIMCAVVYTEDKLAMVVVAAVGLAADAVLYALCRLQKLPASAVSRGAVPYILWLMIAVHVLCYMGLNYERFPQASDSVGWQAFFSFSSFLTLPLNLVPMLLLTALSCGVHTLVLGVTVAQRFDENLHGPMLVRQVKTALSRATVNLLAYSLIKMDGKESNADVLHCHFVFKNITAEPLKFHVLFPQLSSAPKVISYMRVILHITAVVGWIISTISHFCTNLTARITHFSAQYRPNS